MPVYVRPRRSFPARLRRVNKREIRPSLLEHLAGKEFPECHDENVSDGDYATFAFFESYFSNYIEGTVFELDEARRIVATAMDAFRA